MDKKLKIVMLSRHGCFRVFKEAWPLIEKGHDVHLIVDTISQGSERMATVTRWQNIEQLYRAIKLHADADVFHAHNEPAWFVTAVKDVFPDKPVVLDIHDSHLLRKTQAEQDEEVQTNPKAFRISIDERNNFQLADALVYVCEPMKRVVGGEFALEQPSVVLPSYVPKSFYRIDFNEWQGGLVYEGRIDTSDELNAKWRAFFRYSDYLEFGRKCKELGVDFHVYTPRQNEEVRKQYGELSILHDPLNLDKLIKAMGSHDWGLVGNLHQHTEWTNALPNKLFEYFAACLPVVAMHAEESARIIEEYGMGMVVESVEELRSRWREHRAARANVIRHRYGFAMENHIHLVEKLYAQAIEAARPMRAVIPIHAAG